MTEILLSSTKLGLLDRASTVDSGLSMSLGSLAILVLEHSPRISDGGARLPEVGVEALQLERSATSTSSANERRTKSLLFLF